MFGTPHTSNGIVLLIVYCYYFVWILICRWILIIKQFFFVNSLGMEINNEKKTKTINIFLAIEKLLIVIYFFNGLLSKALQMKRKWWYVKVLLKWETLFILTEKNISNSYYFVLLLFYYILLGFNIYLTCLFLFFNFYITMIFFYPKYIK